MPRRTFPGLALSPLLAALPLHVQAQSQHDAHAHMAHPPAQSSQPARPAGAADPHAGHAMPDAPAVADPPQPTGHEYHAGHAAAASAPPAPLPPPTPQDMAAAFPDLHGMRMQDHMDDDPVLATLLFDRLEWQDSGAATGLGWELQGWVGDLENRVWLRSEGERRDGTIAHGDVEVLWGRPTGPWWDALIGVRHDLGPGPSRDWLAFGVQGLAPYKFEVSATGYVGSEGRLAATVEAEYELLLTNRLILQPRAELNAFSKDDRERGIGRGVSDGSLGLRLRYEIHRQFAPYVGYEWERSFGRTARFASDAGESRSERMWVAGIRFWF
jgi:copper resistance protein B